MSLQQFKISMCRTHHLKDGIPLYKKRFNEVLAFHSPGLAAVKDATAAYHIHPDGTPAYKNRFDRTFGFYEGKSTVAKNHEMFHIFPDGSRVYPENYQWCGNFQDDVCAVRNSDAQCFHIDADGNALYREKYTYAGDFKDGIAVVCNGLGKSSHITKDGKFTHNVWFSQLDVFHKGFARAKDAHGWMHITCTGVPLYKERFASVEPFYNGVAHVEKKDGTLLLITEEGKPLRFLTNPETSIDLIADLSQDMVGFWKTWTLRVATDLHLFSALPGTLKEISERISLPSENTLRILRALWEIHVVAKDSDNMWHSTQKGLVLSQDKTEFLASASYLWSQVNLEWQNLGKILHARSVKGHLSFKHRAQREENIRKCLHALDGYAHHDFRHVVDLFDWSQHQNIAGVGRSAATFLSMILEKHPRVNAHLIGDSLVFRHARFLKKHQKRLACHEGDFCAPLTMKQDAILFPRYLHYFPDDEAVSLLKNAKTSLKAGGIIYVCEMLLVEDSANGGMLDLNMLVETGGKLRTVTQWENLCARAGLQITEKISVFPHLSVLKVTT